MAGSVTRASAYTVFAVGLGFCLLLRAQRKRSPIRAAVAMLSGAAIGALRFEEFAPYLCFGGYTRVSGVIRGLKPGEHGVAVHEHGDLSDGVRSCGVHFNPGQCAHGAPEDPIRHVGDLGNIVAGAHVRYSCTGRDALF